MTIVGIALLALLLACVLFAPRRWALLGMVAAAMYLPLGQVVEAFGLHLYAVRFVCLAAFCRAMSRKETSAMPLNAVDRMLLIAYGYRTLVYILHDNGSAVNAIGLMGDVVLAYFAVRRLVSGVDDLVWVLRATVFLLGPYVAMLMIEMTTTRNPLGVVGGIDPVVFRNGRPRCLGGFAHASILGTFGASFLPLYIALLAARRGAILGVLGIVFCAAIVFASNSGGPLSCAVLAVIGWMLWPLRRHMAAVRVALVLLLLGLVASMEAPIWYLPAKISDFSGGDGWHRSYLMEVSFKYLGQWWLAGMSVLQTSDWFPYRVVTGGADIINYYLDFGFAGGLVAMGLLIALLVRAFAAVGRTVAGARSDQPARRARALMAWGLGCVLATHVFNWFGLVYFDQYYVIFLFQLAALASLSTAADPVALPVARGAETVAAGWRSGTPPRLRRGADRPPAARPRKTLPSRQIRPRP